MVTSLKEFGLTLRLAWREIKHEKGKVAFAFFAAILGSVAITTVNVFQDSFETSINTQGKTLTGADLRIKSNRPLKGPVFSDIEKPLVIGKAEKANVIKFNSMLLNLKARSKAFSTRLVSVHGIKGKYPFYGRTFTSPEQSWETLLAKPKRGIIIDASLATLLKISIGSKVRLGEATFKVIGTSEQKAGGTSFGLGIGLPVFIHYEDLKYTRLIQSGSQVKYNAYYKVPQSFNIEEYKKEKWKMSQKNFITIYTFAESSAGIRRFFKFIFQFFQLASLSTLFLGALGIAVTISVFVKSKIKYVAILKSLGASNRRLVSIFFTIAFVISVVGSTIGSLLGVLLPKELIPLVSDLIPITITLNLNIMQIIEGSGLVILTALAFTVLPISQLRKVSPLQTIRSSAGVEKSVNGFQKKLLVFFAMVSIFMLVILIVGEILGDFKVSFVFLLGIAATLVILLGLSFLVLKVSRKLSNAILNYPIKQGLKNLYRPGNQTSAMVVASGFGIFLVSFILVIQASLSKEISLAQGEKPNLFLIDVANKQRALINRRMIEEKIIDEKIVFEGKIGARLHGLNNKSFDMGKVQLNAMDRGWKERIKSKEYFISSRVERFSSDAVVDGEWWGKKTEEIEASVDSEWAKSINVKLGTVLNMSVAGLPIDAKVTSIRRIDWSAMQPNSIIVLSPGALVGAPLSYYSSFKVSGRENKIKSIHLLASEFSNVTVFDTAMAVERFQGIAEQIEFIIQWISISTLVTGLIILLGSLLSQRGRRLVEAMLLKVLGASSNTIRKILVTEFVFLALIGSIVGLVCALGLGLVVVKTFFETKFYLPLISISVTISCVILTTVIGGLLTSRDAIETTPMSLLKEN